MIDLEDEKKKERNFNVVYGMMRDLEAMDAAVVNSLYHYRVSDQKIFEEEAKIITREYKMGVLDPTKDVTKFEQKQMYRKRREILKLTMKKFD